MLIQIKFWRGEGTRNPGKERPGSDRIVSIIRSVERLGDDADAEDRTLCLVEQLHLPLGVLRELARDHGGHVGTGRGQGLPGGVAIDAFGAVFGSSGISAVADAKEIERHDWYRRAIVAPDR